MITKHVSGITFQAPPLAIPPLAEAEVHLWAGKLEANPELEERFRSLLSEDELERAHHFQNEEDASRFLRARGMLRTLLGTYLRMEPAALKFTYSAQGKPGLEGVTSLSFNLSHSVGLVAMAFSFGWPVGVDLERRRTVPEAEAILRRLFPGGALRAYRQARADEQPMVFLQYWTRLEALQKAIGSGVGEAPPNARRGWRVLSFMQQDWIGALAVHQKISRVHAWKVDLDWFL